MKVRSLVLLLVLLATACGSPPIEPLAKVVDKTRAPNATATPEALQTLTPTTTNNDEDATSNIQLRSTATPEAPQTLTPTPSPTFTEYTAQEGDTIFDIAIAFGTTLDAIGAINRFDPNSIILQPGQTILLPLEAVITTSTPAPSLTSTEYTLQKDDILLTKLTLDGRPVTEEKEWDELRQRLPLIVSIDNNERSRPPSGLAQAELVYEIVSEGGITRFLAVYWRNDAEKIMPVRSARVFHLPIALELDGILAHYGLAAPKRQSLTHVNVLEALKILPVRNIDGGQGDDSGPFLRDLRPEYAVEHTAYTSADMLRITAEERGWQGPPQFDPWLFKDDSVADFQIPSAPDIHLSFGKSNLPAYNVQWTYDKTTNSYLRSQGGKPARDEVSGDQLSAKNIVVQFVNVEYLEQKMQLPSMVGEGKATIFQDGQATEGTWEKLTSRSRTRYFDKNGHEIKFNRGTTWLEIASTEGSTISY